MDDSLTFRNLMAERGFEYTPQQAVKAMEAAMNFQSLMDRTAVENPGYFDQLEMLDLAGKQEICQKFADRGCEITVTELEQLIEVILDQRDRSF